MDPYKYGQLRTATAVAASALRKPRAGHLHFVFNKFLRSAVAEQTRGHRRRSAGPPGPPPPALRPGFSQAPLPAGCPAERLRPRRTGPARRGGDGARPPLGPALPSSAPPAAAPPPGVSPGPRTAAGTGGAAAAAAALPGPALGKRAAPAELGHEVRRAAPGAAGERGHRVGPGAPWSGGCAPAGGSAEHRGWRAGWAARRRRKANCATCVRFQEETLFS